MEIAEGMALVVGTMVLFGALAWWADKRWTRAPEHVDEPPAPIVIQYPLDDAPWPKKDGLDQR